jgi:hypothetical protein
MAAQASQPVTQFGQVGGAVIVQIRRVKAERSEQAVIGLHQVPQPLPILPIHPQHHHVLYAQLAAMGEDFPAVAVELREVQVGVGVDQRHVHAS